MGILLPLEVTIKYRIEYKLESVALDYVIRDVATEISRNFVLSWLEYRINDYSE